MEVVESYQDITFTDPEISFELVLIPIRVNTGHNSMLGRDALGIPASVRWADENDIQIRREVWEDRNGLDRILYETHAVARVVILVPAIPKEDHLDMGTGKDHLLHLRQLWQVVRNRPRIHLVVRRHQIQSAVFGVPQVTLMAHSILQGHSKPPFAAAAAVLHLYGLH